MSSSPGTILPEDLQTLLLSDNEHALIDVRETDAFSRNHLLFAVPIPLGRLEFLAADLLPRKFTPLVICDDGEGLADKAAIKFSSLGYSNISVLVGGVTGWGDAGYEIYSGVNVPSKAFGEFIEHEDATPSLSADEVHAMMEDGEDMIILDSRPFTEFNWASIPTGLCCSGAELVYRAFAAIPDPETTVIVNCAGRTRSIIGAQSLINAGLPNKVYALRNGIMGWRLSGFKPDNGGETWVPLPDKRGISESKAAANRVFTRFQVQQITPDELTQWREQRSERCLYIIDVRTIEEFEAGHLFDAVHGAGGQVVQATDEYIATRNARIVLVDNDGIRASMTASWLNQMGQKGVRTMLIEQETKPLIQGKRSPRVLGLDKLDTPDLNTDDVALKLEDGALILDLSLSSAYRAGHISGAWFVLRSQLAASLAALPEASTYILTSENGELARLCINELKALTSLPVYCLKGGNAAWANAGQSLIKGDEKFSVAPIDIWRIPFVANKEKGETVEDAMRAYLHWEVDLMAQLSRDGTTRFQRYSQAS
ncbi:MAG: rhodanese-like domain-containing protein [Pseudomonadales bacterium]|jgi:rhodanese-related sulfurtransferase